MNDIVMPKLSDTMTEGRLVAWRKRVGDTVKRGDVLAEVETDKANMELEAFTAGTLLELKAHPGDLVAVGTVIAVIGKPEEKGAAAPGGEAPAGEAPGGETPAGETPAGETPAGETPAGGAPGGGAAPTGEETPTPSGAKEGAEEPPKGQPEEGAKEGEAKPAPPAEGGAEKGKGEAPAQEGKPTGEVPMGHILENAEEPGIAPQPPAEGEPEAGGEPAGAPKHPAEPAPRPAAAQPAQPPGEVPKPAPSPQSGESREKAAPVVRRRARELGIDLAAVKGSGPDGRILLQDLYDAQSQQPQQQQQTAGQPALQPPSAGQPAKQAPRPALQEGTQPLPRLRAAIAKTVTQSWRSIPHFTVTMEILMDEAESLRHQLKETGIPVTVNDLIVKAVALALQDFRLLNASFGEDGIHAAGDINIGVAVGVQDGVLIPVIPGCQNLSLKEISETGRKLAEKARSGSLSEQEMSGGTFAVSNLGMYGVSDFTAVIYPTHSGVMAVGAVTDTVIVRAGVPACAKVMKVTVCADHRLVDGAYVAEFLVRFKSILENPVRIIV